CVVDACGDAPGGELDPELRRQRITGRDTVSEHGAVADHGDGAPWARRARGGGGDAEAIGIEPVLDALVPGLQAPRGTAPSHRPRHTPRPQLVYPPHGRRL